MPNEKQDLTNHRQVAVACKNYTDKEIKASEERILSIVARNNVDFIDHTNEPTYRFTAPANSKLLMLQSIGGNSVKYSPSVASDNNASHIKTLPSTVYDLDVSKVEGVGYKVNQLVNYINFVGGTNNGVTITKNNNGSITVSGTLEATSVSFNMIQTSTLIPLVNGVKYGIAISGCKNPSKVNFFSNYAQSYGTNGNVFNIFTSEYTYGTWWNIRVTGEIGDVINETIYPQIFNLTDMGINPTDITSAVNGLLARGINPYEYNAYDSGSIHNNAFTGATVEGSNLRYLPNTTLSQQGAIIPRYLVNLPRGTYSISFDWTGGGDMAIICENSSLQTINLLTLEGLSSGRNGGTFTITQEAVYIRGYSNNASGGTISNIMLNNGSTAMSYTPYIQPTTISVDLTTIKDSNNNSLFPSGKMMGNSSVADFITPYNQESRWNEYTFTGNETWYVQTNYAYAIINGFGGKQSSTNVVGTINEISAYQIGSSNSDVLAIWLDVATYDTSEKINNLTRGKTIQYERATYLTSNTDLTSLTGIQGQSLGTITLNNTGNVDMPNLISYNGVIKHSLATAVKQDGFNVWDEQWELGSIESNGQPSVSTTRIRSKNFNDCYPNTTYYFYVANAQEPYVFWYDENYNFINFDYMPNRTKVSPNNAHYFKIRENGTTYNNGICINISNQDLNGTYKPYKAPITRLLPNSEAKYSWGITDGVRNTRVFCDDECNPVNEGQLDVGNQDLGLQTWGKTTVFYTTLNDMKPLAQTICNNFETYIMGESLPNYDCIQIRSNKDIYFRYQNDSPYASLEANVFKSSMNGVMLEFKKATTDTETLDDFDFSFDCEEGDTFTIIGCELLQCYATYSFLIKEAKSNE